MNRSREPIGSKLIEWTPSSAIGDIAYLEISLLCYRRHQLKDDFSIGEFFFLRSIDIKLSIELSNSCSKCFFFFLKDIYAIEQFRTLGGIIVHKLRNIAYSNPILATFECIVSIQEAYGLFFCIALVAKLLKLFFQESKAILYTLESRAIFLHLIFLHITRSKLYRENCHIGRSQYPYCLL